MQFAAAGNLPETGGDGMLIAMRSSFVAVVLVAAAAVAFVATRDDAAAADVKGLWSRFPHGTGKEADPVAFYYFHDGDIGLYRYGKVAYNNTHSYHWNTENGTLVLDYNKTGEHQALRYRVLDENPKVLVIVDDPHNPGVKETRYTWVPPPDFRSVAADLFDDEEDDEVAASSDVSPSAERIDNRLWMDLKSFKTGGMGFALYQLRPAGIDGRGTGWHHLGDFNDWSTEALSYRLIRGSDGQAGSAVDLLFTLRNERSSSPLQVGHRSVDGKDVRFLTIQSDPRGFWAAHSYDDAGPSFGSFLVDGALADDD